MGQLSMGSQCSRQGTALIFPTATLDGLADERYLHSGEPVERGTKWIVGTWLMEVPRTDAEASPRPSTSFGSWRDERRRSGRRRLPGRRRGAAGKKTCLLKEEEVEVTTVRGPVQAPQA